MSEASSLYVNWNGQELAWYRDEAGLGLCQDIDFDEGLPILPDGCPEEAMVGASVLLPVERLLLRSLHFPLNAPSLLDAELLQQELADRAGIDPAEWWLCWHFSNNDEGGIAGMVFGIPESLRLQMQQSEEWQQLAYLGPDIWPRLQEHVADVEQPCAVLDQDASGLFIGVFTGGCWRGMRRINITADEDGAFDAGLWQQFKLSLEAMGFDADSYLLHGRIDAVLQSRLQESGWQWQGEVQETLLPRYHANLRALDQPDSLRRNSVNFRRGRWAARGSWQAFRPWVRSVALAAGLLLLFIVGLMVQVSSLEQQHVEAEARVVEAFHLGLPDESVMIDPLAQLRKAIGGASSSQQSSLLSHLQAVARSYKRTPWIMKSLSVRKGTVLLSGEVADVKSLNQLQTTLEEYLGTSVKIADTNLAQSNVNFRIEWQ